MVFVFLHSSSMNLSSFSRSSSLLVFTDMRPVRLDDVLALDEYLTSTASIVTSEFALLMSSSMYLASMSPIRR